MPRTPPQAMPAPIMAVEEIIKPDVHASKAINHSIDRDRVGLHHKERAGVARVERHSANGHSIHEQPKKNGAGGKGTWGTWRDDVHM